MSKHRSKNAKLPKELRHKFALYLILGAILVVAFITIWILANFRTGGIFQ